LAGFLFPYICIKKILFVAAIPIERFSFFVIIFSLLLTKKTFIDKFNLFANFRNF
jgi:hypothetical protein